MTRSIDILSHPLFVKVFGDFQSAVMRLKSEAPTDPLEHARWRAGNRRRMTAAERYATDIFYRLMSLNRVCQRIAHSKYLLGRAPSSFQNRALSFSRDEWTSYHFYVYTTSHASILDCLLLVAAEIFVIGLPERLCTYQILTAHRAISGGDTDRAVRALKNLLEKQTQRRHRFIHRGEESSFRDLTDPEQLWQLQSMTLLHTQGRLDTSDRFLDVAWRQQVRRIRPALDQNDEAVHKQVLRTLKSLLPIYERNLDALNH